MEKFININQAIIDKCKKGDKKAQFELYKQYYKAMYNTALRIVQNSAEAEDLMQEAFLSAFKNIESYKGEVSFGAWLKKIVINKCLDHLKRNKIDFNELDKSAYKIAENENDDEKFEDTAKQIEEIKKAIDCLPDGYRIIITLYLIEGYDHDEIAEILNITSSTSRSQFVRAKKKLIEILQTN